MGLLSKLGLITLLFDSPFGSDTYNQVFLCPISPRKVTSDLIFPTRNTAIFGFPSGDYGPESVWDRDGTPSELGRWENYLTDYQ